MDLAMFGCSFAAGFGAGKERVDNFDIAYPRLIAAKLNVENFYNFSMPARSISSSSEDMIEFAEKYIEINKSGKNLFILGELADPKYIKIPTVVGTDNNVYKPTMLFNGPYGYSDYRYMYCKLANYSNVINDPGEVYVTHNLSPGEIKVIITPESIEYIKKHVKSILHDMKSPLIDTHQIYSDALDTLCVMTGYLKKRNIRYLLTWILPEGKQAEHHFRIMDKAKFDSCFDSRFLNPQQTSLTSIISSNNDLIGEFEKHPSKAGHKVIADNLYDYIIRYNLLEHITQKREIN